MAAPPGTYIPQCDENGEYRPLQFHASMRMSWCVTREGIRIQGTQRLLTETHPTCSPFTGTFNPGFVRQTIVSVVLLTYLIT